jgi:hypothetical protein
MAENPSTRSVKIGADERTGWSSERPRSGAGPARPADISGRCKVLSPSFRLRYSPGSILLVIGATGDDPAGFAERVIEERGVLIAPARVRSLLAGRVPEAEIDERARELLHTAVGKRLAENQSVVVPLEGFDAEERELFARAAHKLRRPRRRLRRRATDARRSPPRRRLRRRRCRGLPDRAPARRQRPLGAQEDRLRPAAPGGLR